MYLHTSTHTDPWDALWQGRAAPNTNVWKQDDERVIHVMEGSRQDTHTQTLYIHKHTLKSARHAIHKLTQAGRKRTNKLTDAHLFDFFWCTCTAKKLHTHTHTNKGIKCCNTDKNTDALCTVTSRQ